jgi:hypothetical protein
MNADRRFRSYVRVTAAGRCAALGQLSLFFEFSLFSLFAVVLFQCFNGSSTMSEGHLSVGKNTVTSVEYSYNKFSVI